MSLLSASDYPRAVVELVQTALHFQNIYTGVIDGSWGPKTEAAFQIYAAANQPLNFKYRYDLASCELDLTPGQSYDLKMCLAAWLRNKLRYQAVEAVVNLPAKLIAALHWRECSGDFRLYLQQGDKLGTVTYANGRSNNGRTIPFGTQGTIFFKTDQWNEAAILALRDKTALQSSLRITKDTTDLNLLCEYAENYNGLGYRRRNKPSPYVLAGTACYTGGKFVADGEYSADAVDRQLGVLPILRTLT